MLQRLPPAKDTSPAVIPWFRDPEHWKAARRVLRDGVLFRKLHRDWLKMTLRTVELLERSGRTVVKIEPDISLYFGWAEKTGHELSMTSLCKYCQTLEPNRPPGRPNRAVRARLSDTAVRSSADVGRAPRI